MCGIIGYSGKAGFDPFKLKLLFLYNQSRGEDSAGFYTNSEGESLADRRVRVLGKASEKLLPMYSFKEEAKNSNLFIGHTRKKSVGSSYSVQQAHPFITKTFAGVHNGTFSNWKDVKKAFEITDIDVDSHIFYEVLERVKNPLEAIGYFEGGAALVFSSTEEDNTLYVYRNEQRDLFRGTCKDDEGNRQIYISSMEASLEAIGCGNIQIFKPGRLYKITEGEVECIRKPIVKKMLPIPREKSVSENYEIVKVINRTRKTLDETYKGSHQRLYQYSDESFVTGFTSDFFSHIKRELIIYCKDRKKYFYRIVHASANSMGPDKIFEVALPNLQEKDAPNLNNLALDESLEGVVALMYRLYGELTAYEVHLEETFKEHGIEDKSNTLESVLMLMSGFLGIATQ